MHDFEDFEEEEDDFAPPLELDESVSFEAIVEEGAMYEHFSLTAAKGQTFLRVDKYLTNLLPNVSRSKIQHAAEIGYVTVNGKVVKGSYKVKPFDKISLMLPYPPPPKLAGEDIPINIFYEDEDLLIVNKIADMVCHPSIGHHTGTLVHALIWHFQNLPAPLMPQNVMRPGLVHRIDKGTSGLLVIAKNEAAMVGLGKQFFDHSTERLYYAIVWGDLKQEEGTITGHIGRSIRNRKLFMVYPEGDQGKRAVTHYKVLERFGIATLIQCKLETGRTHQIRVHLKHIGHTLVGDSFYGGDLPSAIPNATQKMRLFALNCLDIIDRQALHAKTLGFIHPRTKEKISFDSELPNDFQLVIEKFRTWKEGHLG
ncbi:MAG: RluA family pseudouridine synthase [Bacteroidia bacterium]